MTFTAKELKERIEVKLRRVEACLKDPNTSDRVKNRLLHEEHATYIFALKGLEPYLKEKASSSATDPAPTAGPQTA